jgi:hypothetical protein
MKISSLLAIAVFFSASFTPGRLLAEEEKAAEPTREQKIYYFQHRLLPKWTYGSQGAFFEDLKGGKVEQMVEAASKIVDTNFAKQLKVRSLEDGTKVLITFEEPKQPRHCHFVLIEKMASVLQFITLERTEDILNVGTKAALCGWSEDGKHLNYGSRKYSDEARFLTERSAKKKTEANQTPEPTATAVTPATEQP